MTRSTLARSIDTGRSLDGALGLVGRTVQVARTALIVRRQRRALLALDDRMLADIGLSRSQAYCEASRPLTDLPDRLA